MVRRGGLAVTAVLLLAFCATARAEVVHPYLGSFGPDGAAGSAFGRPGAVAVDQSDGDVYVADTAAGAIYKFGPDGEPVDFAALGSNRLEGLSFSDAEPGLVELAVNSTTHDLYVVENAPVNAVSVFHADGEPAEFTALGSHTLTGFTELCGVAVDSEGDVYAADYEGGVSVFDPSGAPLTSAAVSHACSVAVGPGGDLFANLYQGAVERLTPSSYPITGTTTYGPGTIVDPETTFGVAVDPISGDLYADERGAIAQYDAAGALLGRSGDEGEGALGESEGVAVAGGSGLLFATAPQLGGGSSDRIARYGPGETEQPRVEAEWVTAVGDAEATLNAEINPLGAASTYHFEYGPGTCAGGECISSAEAPLGSGSEALTVSLPIAALQPGSDYNFRVVVTTAAGSRPGLERTFRTYPLTSGVGTALPDDRGYELVSPGPDNSAELGVPGATSGLVLGGVVPQRAAADGEAFAFPSFVAFGEATGAPNASYFLSRHSPNGWAMNNITPRDESRGPVGPVRAFSPNLGSTAVVADSALAPGAVPGYPNLYLRDNADGALTALTTTTPAFTSSSAYCVNYIGSSADGRRVIFAASGGLTPEAPAPEQGGQPNLYEWSAAGGIRLVSLLPNGTAAETGTGLGFGPGDDTCLIDGTEVSRHAISDDGRRIFWSQTRPRALYARVDGTRTIELDRTQGGAGPDGGGTFVAASADGSRVFFTDPNPLVPGAGQGTQGAGDLYEYRLGGEALVDLTPQGSEPSEVLGLVGASEDGSYVYFVATGALTEGAEAGRANLYLDHEGTLRLVARLSRSEDGFDWVPFTRQTATVSPDGLHLAFVSVEPLTGYDNELAGGGTCRRGIAGEPEGGRRCDEVFLYDAASNRLSCASCNPSGANPSGPVKARTGAKESRLNVVPGWTTPFEGPRYLSADGSRLFFLSEEGLVPADTNGEQDVYEFERPNGSGGGDCTGGSPTYVPAAEGCLSLISSGRATDGSYLLDASADGRDVFFSTNQALAAADEDGSYDIYDARVGGGSPAAAPEPVPCAAEGCRSASGSPPPSGSVGTGGEGEPPFKPRVCPRGKVRRGGHCVLMGRHRPGHHKKRKHHGTRGHHDKRGGKR